MARADAPPTATPTATAAGPAAVSLDQLGRPLGVLRLSLTARCNLACPYCLPDGQEPEGVLTLEQRLRVISAAVALGARSLRLTGGEPLLHGQLEELIASAARPALREIALTSNGVLLSAARARALRRAGLNRITFSLDGATGEAVARMAGVGGGDPQERERRGDALLAKVLAAIEHARAAGFDPGRGELKLNAVIQRGANDDQLLPLAALARERGLELRLIEFMDVGNRNGWRRPSGGGGLGECPLLRRLQPPARHRRRHRLHLPVRRPRQRPGSTSLADAPGPGSRAASGDRPALAGPARPLE